jgi:DNA-binding NarL/FixJ family response regulator
MGSTKPKTIIVAGDTPRWLKTVQQALPEECTKRVCAVPADVYSILTDESTRVDLCIFANTITKKNDGIDLLSELQEADDPRVILFTSEISDADRQHAESLGGTVIDFIVDDATALKHAVRTLLAA